MSWLSAASLLIMVAPRAAWSKSACDTVIVSRGAGLFVATAMSSLTLATSVSMRPGNWTDLSNSGKNLS